MVAQDYTQFIECAIPRFSPREQTIAQEGYASLTTKTKKPESSKMAIRHCSIKHGKVGKGAAHAAYISGVGKYADKDDVIFLRDGNLPEWATDATDFFAAADELERANGRAYTEIEFAIPRELDAVCQEQFALAFAQELMGDRFVHRLAIHDKPAADGGRNTHGHLMFSERALDGIERGRDQFFRRANPKAPEKGGAAKDRRWNDREMVQVVRDLFADNSRQFGIEIDMRSNEAQGLGAPEPKIGIKAKGRMTVVKAKAAEVVAIRAERKAKTIAPRLLQALLARFESEGLEHATAKAAEAGKRYTGQVTEITATELAQDLGMQTYAVHQLGHLDRKPAVGDVVAIQYGANNHAVVHDRGRGKTLTAQR